MGSHAWLHLQTCYRTLEPLPWKLLRAIVRQVSVIMGHVPWDGIASVLTGAADEYSPPGSARDRSRGVPDA
jgi:hypothetical protein